MSFFRSFTQPGGLGTTALYYAQVSKLAQTWDTTALYQVQVGKLAQTWMKEGGGHDTTTLCPAHVDKPAQLWGGG